MNIKDEKINERRITANFSQEELEHLVIDSIAKEVGLNNNVKAKVRFFNKDEGPYGFKTMAEVIIVKEYKGDTNE